VASDDIGRIEWNDLVPPYQILERIKNRLDERRLVGTRVGVHSARYVGLTVVLSLSSRPRFDPAEVRSDVLRALYRLYHPLIGGPDGTGWPFGRSAQSHEVHAALAGIPGVDLSREVSLSLRPADPNTGGHSAAVERMDLPPTALVYSYDHQVRVTR
jgi:predicted phage baseplate assembly protein